MFHFERGEWPLLLLSSLIALLVFFSFLFALSAVLLRLANIRKAARWARLETAWESLLLDVLAGAKTPEALLERVAGGDQLFFVDFLLRYARRLQGEERKILSSLARPFLPRVATHLKRGDPEHRACAILTLSALGLPDYSKEVLSALDDPSPLVAMVAARAMARREHPQYAGAVIEHVPRFENWSTHYLASMLAGVGPPVAAPLRLILLDASRPLVGRVVAAEALRKLHDLEAAETAVKVLETETDHDMVAATLRLLCMVGRPEHVGAIRAKCESTDSVIRIHAIDALGHLGTAEDVTRLKQALDDPSPWVAAHAAWGLNKLGSARLLQDIAASDHPRANLARQVLLEIR